VLTPAEYFFRKSYHDTFNYAGETRTWTSATVSRILRNEMYIGNYIYGRFKSEEVGAKHPVVQSENDWKKIENHHEAIISEELFDKVQKKRGVIEIFFRCMNHIASKEKLSVEIVDIK